MKKIFILSLLFISVVVIGFSRKSKIPRGFKQLGKKEYEKAEKLLLDVSDKSSYSSVIRYGFATLYFNKEFKKYDPLIAYDSIQLAISKYKLNNAQDRLEMANLDITFEDYKDLKKNIEIVIYSEYRGKETIDALTEYLKKYPTAFNYYGVKNLRNELAFDAAIEIGTAESYSNFIEEYPESAEAKLAEKRKNELAYIELLEKQRQLLKKQTQVDSLVRLQHEIEYKALETHAKEQAKFIIVLIILGLIILVFAVYLIFSRLKIKKSNAKIRAQRRTIVAKNEHIKESLRYAKYIQEGLLPDTSLLKKYLADHFIFYRPRDIVSGDFYWFAETDDKVIIAVVDCTGHGVPGAFMSMVGHTLLSHVVHKEEISKPSEILFELRKDLIKALNPNNEKKELSEGMDMALISMDKNKTKLEFAGAFNSLFLLRKGELREIKADRQPIAIHFEKTGEPFTNHEINIERDDLLYMHSDGFQDQFGGTDDKKYSKKRFKQDLVEISGIPLKDQKEALDRKINDWMGQKSATDDMLVLGIKV